MYSATPQFLLVLWLLACVVAFGTIYCMWGAL